MNGQKLFLNGAKFFLNCLKLIVYTDLSFYGKFTWSHLKAIDKRSARRMVRKNMLKLFRGLIHFKERNPKTFYGEYYEKKIYVANGIYDATWC